MRYTGSYDDSLRIFSFFFFGNIFVIVVLCHVVTEFSLILVSHKSSIGMENVFNSSVFSYKRKNDCVIQTQTTSTVLKGEY